MNMKYGIIGAIMMLVGAVYAMSKSDIVPAPMPYNKPVEAYDTIIFAPHPDDETLCCAGLMRQLALDNKRVGVSVITNGEAHTINNFPVSLRYGAARKGELYKVLDELLIGQEDIFFMNYPDSYLSKLTNTEVITSEYTGQWRSDMDSYKPQSLYTRSRLVYILSDFLENTRPAHIYTTSKEDNHSDHKALESIIIDSIIATQKQIPDYNPKLYTYTIHVKHKRLNTREDAFKKRLIEMYRSQFHTAQHADFMEYYASRPEEFTEIPYK